MINADVNVKNWLTKKYGGRVFIWDPSNCECECDKPRDVGKYLDHKNCKRRKRLTDKLVEECSEDIDGNEMIYNGTLNDHEKVCSSCTVYIVLLVILVLPLKQ